MIGKKNLLKDLSFLHQHVDEISDEKVKELLNQIAEECCCQELEKLMMPVSEV